MSAIERQRQNYSKSLYFAKASFNSCSSFDISKALNLATAYLDADSLSSCNTLLNSIHPLCEVVTVDFSDMHWIENKNMRLKYIYNKEHKIAFSVYDDELEGDYVLDEYGIRDWYDENCTYKSIALGTITRTFKIIGL